MKVSSMIQKFKFWIDIKTLQHAPVIQRVIQFKLVNSTDLNLNHRYLLILMLLTKISYLMCFSLIKNLILMFFHILNNYIIDLIIFLNVINS